MLSWCRCSLQALRRHPVRNAVLLAVAGLGLAFGARHAWAWQHWRAAGQALDRYDFDQARTDLDVCVKVWPRSFDTQFLAARTARRAGAAEDAEHHLTTCEALPGHEEAVALERSLARAQRGDLPGVEGRLLRQLKEDTPDSTLILEALAQGYTQTYRLPEALHCLDRLLQRAPEHVPALVWRGAALEQLNRFTEAESAYRRAIELNPDAEWARLSLGEVLLHVNRIGEATEQFEVLCQRRPDNAAFLLGLARCRHGLGQAPEARQILDDLLKRYPHEPLILSQRGQLALHEGQPAEAEEWLRQAVTLAPGDHKTVYALYQCLQQQGQTDEARACQARLDRIDQDQKRLLELAQEISRMPFAPAQRCEAGVLCLRLGKGEEGVRWLQGALQQEPRQPAAHQALAEYYERVGQPELAIRHLRLAGQLR